MVWCTKLSLVGSELRQTLHIRFLILFGTCKDQTSFHNALSCLSCSLFSTSFSLNFKKRYPDLLVYDPFLVKRPKPAILYFMLWQWQFLINSASSETKMPSMRPWFHCFPCSSIRISTLALDIVSMIGDSTCREFFLHGHESCQILTNFPLPILHLHPLSKTSLPLKMLAQA